MSAATPVARATPPAAGHAQRVAVIEDDRPTSDQLKGWILAARPAIAVDQWFTRDDAEAALARQRYDAVVLDIELGRERHAGVAIINAINKRHAGTPVLVVSAMPAAVYRSIMKALDAWDYLQKTTFEEAEFIETLLEILRSTSALHERAERGVADAAGPARAELVLDPLRQAQALYRGQRVNLPLTAQRILAVLHARRGEVVSYEEMYAAIKSGRNRDNVRKHVGTIREALREIEPAFDAIDNVPMRGFRWRS
ncbi:MAG: response regulator transcription factor [Rubrivivax sp.]|nr:response regulator transcription factor [Rubrivivax sp.]